MFGFFWLSSIGPVVIVKLNIKRLLFWTQAAQALVVRSYYLFFKKTIFMRTFSSWNKLSWHCYRRHPLLHNDLPRNVTLAFQHVDVLCYNGLNLQRFVWGKTLKGILAEILIFFVINDLPQCLVVFSIVLLLFSAIWNLLSELSLFEFPLLRKSKG